MMSHDWVCHPRGGMVLRLGMVGHKICVRRMIRCLRTGHGLAAGTGRERRQHAMCGNGVCRAGLPVQVYGSNIVLFAEMYAR